LQRRKEFDVKGKNIPSANILKDKIEKLILIGLIATTAFDLVMYTDMAITGLTLDIPKTLGELVLGEDKYSEPVGHLIHIGNGIGLSLFFGFVVLPISKKIVKLPTVLYGILFAIFEAIVAVWFIMLPLLGAGVAGIGVAPEVPIVTLLRHIVFGFILGALVMRWKIS
jgi:hypothetical protein